MTLTPAYGRDYTSAKSVKADFDGNKDFVIADVFGGQAGRYINKEQLPVGSSVMIRFKQLRSVTVIKVK